jgi:hypothetical protein
VLEECYKNVMNRPKIEVAGLLEECYKSVMNRPKVEVAARVSILGLSSR